MEEAKNNLKYDRVKPRIVLFGTSHIAMSLAKVAKAIDYKVDVFMTSVEGSEKETTDNEQITINNEDYYMNPVCNIPIQKSTAKHVLEYKEEKVYFCCDGCKVSFEKDPAAYIK